MEGFFYRTGGKEHLQGGGGGDDLSDDRNCKETGIFAGAFAAGSFLCDDRIWNQYCLYAERNHSTSQS